MLKWLLVAGTLACVAGPARADWCHWLQPSEAKKAAGMLSAGATIRQYCLECDYPMQRPAVIGTVVVKQRTMQNELTEYIEVNGVHISLATSYILSGGQWTNLAILTGACGVTEKNAPRFLPAGKGN